MTCFYFLNNKKLTAKYAKEEAQSKLRQIISPSRPLHFLGALCGLHKILLFPILLCCSFYIDAQDCSFTLSKAQKNYEAGVIEQIPQSLQPCIEKGFTKEEKLQAYKLIIQCYLFDNNSAEAEKAMLNFLKKNPEYEILPTDQAEFVHLFKTYRTLPIASIGFIIGTSIPNIRTIALRSTANANDAGTYSSSGFSYHAGLSFRRFIKSKVDINLEAIYNQTIYQYKNNQLAASTSLNITETQTWVEFPLTAIYYPYTFKKIIPYSRAGMNLKYMLGSSVDATRTTGEVKDFTGPSNNFLKRRVPLQICAVLGAGISYNLPRGNLALDFRYNIGFLNQTAKNRLDMNNLDTQFYYYLDESDISSNAFCVSLIYAYKFYKPQKRK
jgi:hypothetical protein